ncbi:bifunctional DNA-formamidopyrimidine glycosylase/DNA-(apurinic or apyrimidinic site) lyase [Blastomonas sp.]|uniref:bifunctional DNA-formamidopyrimidine glycosylase/DNA-(apurinic or apyrimidinic site) lyase n=1 Tax=Blastomonas sp. TaxID=1909299 RepID=UPI0035938A6C
MPELPEVETTVRGLAAVLQGARITRLVTHRPDLRRAFPPDLAQRMTGATITALGRRAKYGLIATDRGDSMVFHLGMSGRWRIDPDAIGTHDHLVMDTESGHTLSLFDPRRFGSVDLVTTALLGTLPAFAAMGPEPLGDDFTAAYLKRRLAGRAAPIKGLLLDQRIVAGLGNIYVCEALNMARISPMRAAGQIGPAKLRPLVAAIKEVLVQAIAAGGSTLRDYARPDGELGYFAKDWRVYGCEGEACPCGGTVRRVAQSGRSTFYCPSCQR